MGDSTFTFRLDDELKAAFGKLAARQERTAAQLLRVLMRDAVQRSAEEGAGARCLVSCAEVERALHEAADPAIERVPHRKVESSWRQQRAALERRTVDRSA